MAFIDGYTHDSFLSYAHIDDERATGVAEGWVTTLTLELENKVRMLLGQREPTIWRDRAGLRGTDHVSDSLANTLQSTATLLIVLSEGWLNSEWCLGELEAFLQRPRAPGQIFVVEKHPVPRERWPEVLRDLRAYQFWYEDSASGKTRVHGYPVPNPLTGDKYYQLVNDLAHEMADELRRQAADAAPSLSASTDCVYLAETTDDLLEKRESVKRYLEQHGLVVLPDRHYYLDEKLSAKIDGDMKRCRYFVQLLSGIAGRPVVCDGDDISLPTLQHQKALLHELAVMQWRAPGIGLNEDINPHQRALLDDAMEMPLEELKDHVVRHVEDDRRAARQPTDEDESDDVLVFVNHTDVDASLAVQLRETLDSLNVSYAFPLTDGQPSEIRKDLADNLGDCDRLLLLYGEAPITWVRGQMREVKKSFATRDRPPDSGLCQGPPGRDLNMRLRPWKMLDFREGINVEELRRFIAHG